jgi:predicted permease
VSEVTNPTQTTPFRFWRWLIRFIGVIVPRRFRVRFQQEWEAELEYREALLARWDRLDWRSKLKLLWRSLGAFWDALWLQPQRLEDEMIQDLRFGARMLLKQPGFTLIAVVTLALGIGANAALFSLVDALLLRTLPVREAERLALIKRVEGDNRSAYDLPYPMFERLRDQPQVFSEVAANWPIERSETADNPGADPGQLRVGIASGNYFSALGVQAALGRTFTLDDNRAPGAHPVAVISHNYWERRFARAADVIGRTLTLAGADYTIIGVASRGFTGEWVGRPIDLWVPFMMASQVMPEVPGGPPRFPALIIARLQPGVTMAQAQAASQLIYQRGLIEEAGSNLTPQQRQFIAQRRIELESGASGYSVQRETLKQPLQILAGLAGLALLAVCANVANLLLARAAAREKEMAVRQALGAHRLRIIRQLLTESLLLAALGGALGLLFAVWGAKFLAAMLSAGPLSGGIEDNSLSLDLRLDWRLIACASTLCLLVSVLFGLAPALRSSKVALTTALKEGGASVLRGRRRLSLGKALVVAQVALSLVLMIGAGLLARTLRNLQTRDVGFDRENLLLVWAAPAQTGRTVPALVDFAKGVQERLSSLPGVVSASVSNGGVLGGSMRGGRSEAYRFPGQAPKPGLLYRNSSVMPGFFATVGTPLIAGRDFTEMDNENAPEVAIFSETMARFFFGDENPVGKRFNARGGTGYPIEIIGVVKDAKPGTPRDQLSAWYSPYRQGARFMRLNWCIAVRTNGRPLALATSVRHALRELDPNLPVLKVTTIAGQLDYVLAQDRLIAMLSAFFGALAMLLSCLGLYGMVSYTVARRTSEIGIRLALGATPMGVLRMLFKESLWLVLGGIALGVPASLAVTRLIASRLFGVSSTDPLAIGAAIALLMAVAALAAFFPARRASGVDPMIALRSE